MNQQQIVATLKEAGLSPEELKLCLDTLENDSFSEDAITSVILYLISLAKLNESQAKLLAAEIEAYEKVIDILKSSPPRSESQIPSAAEGAEILNEVEGPIAPVIPNS